MFNERTLRLFFV